jgi:energy-coupling factor transport system permease protein
MLATWRYRPHNSFMERIDPRTRWIFSLLFLVSVTFFWDMRFIAVFFVAAMAWYFSARTHWKEIRRAWLFVSTLLVIMIVVNTIITSASARGIIPQQGQHPLWTLDGSFPLTGWRIHFTLTIERLWFALCQMVRILSISAVFLIIPYSMNPRLYGVTFHGLGLGDRIAFSMDLAFRYVPTLARDFQVTLDAQRARGYEIERVQGGLLEQVRRIAPLIVPITMSSIMTGEDVTNAMDLRCFGLQKRTWVEVIQYHWIDYAIIAASVLMLVGSIVITQVFHLGGFWMPPFLLPH